MKPTLHRPFRSIARSVALLVGASMVVLGLSAVSAPAQAYPSVDCSVSVHPQTVKPGHKFTVKGHASITEQWTVTFAGQTYTFNGTDFSTVLTAPTTPGSYTLTVTCNGATGAGTRTFNVTVSAAHKNGGGGGGTLPNTGGPYRWLLIMGVLAILAGLFTIRLSRQQLAPVRAGGNRRAP